MKSWIRGLLCIAVLLAVASGVYEIRHRSQRASKTPIRLGLSVWPGFGPFFIADEKGFFKGPESGMFSLTSFKDDTQRDASLLANRIDAIGMTVDTLAVLRHRGVDVKAVYKFDNSLWGGTGSLPNRNIHSLSELRGKKVGWAFGDNESFLLSRCPGSRRTEDLGSGSRLPFRPTMRVRPLRQGSSMRL